MINLLFWKFRREARGSSSGNVLREGSRTTLAC